VKRKRNFEPAEVAELLKQNEQLHIELDAVKRSADELTTQMRALLESLAEQDAERIEISRNLRRRIHRRDLKEDRDVPPHRRHRREQRQKT
jgi:hypothetical protein